MQALAYQPKPIEEIMRIHKLFLAFGYFGVVFSNVEIDLAAMIKVSCLDSAFGEEGIGGFAHYLKYFTQRIQMFSLLVN